MPTRTIAEAPISQLQIRSDGTLAGSDAWVQIQPAAGLPDSPVTVDMPAAAAAAAAAIGGGRTAAEVRECVRQFYIAARAQARAAGGWA